MTDLKSARDEAGAMAEPVEPAAGYEGMAGRFASVSEITTNYRNSRAETDTIFSAAGRAGQEPSSWPPSTAMDWPVIQEASGEARNSTVLAISSG